MRGTGEKVFCQFGRNKGEGKGSACDGGRPLLVRSKFMSNFTRFCGEKKKRRKEKRGVRIGEKCLKKDSEGGESRN